ncbi:11-beta-hydroxysteroid dehydrogenase 1 [Chlamydotis macqueenii]
MGRLQKILIPFLGLVLAFWFYSARENFKPEMLKGKRVLVTGASTGIGEQMAYHLARMGSHIVITARTEAKLQKVVERCLELGAASARYVSGTMEDMAFAEHVVKEAETSLGGLDMLILNHVGTSYFNYFNGDVGHVRKLLEINFLSYVAMTVSALPMLKKSEGSIVVVSSMAGKVGFPFTVPYSATKFALDGFFSSLRQEFTIQRVNVSITLCILSFIDTEHAVRAAADRLLVSPAPREECALEILKGAALRRRELYYRYGSTRLPLLLRDWAAELLDYLVRSRYRLDGLEGNDGPALPQRRPPAPSRSPRRGGAGGTATGRGTGRGSGAAPAATASRLPTPGPFPGEGRHSQPCLQPTPRPPPHSQSCGVCLAPARTSAEMGLLLKIFTPLLGLALAFYFYSAPENFNEEMLRGKRVIVTGASSGIGEQMAYHLARMEAHLLLTARTEAKLQKVVERCLELGAASARYVSGSMEDTTFPMVVVKEAEITWGGLDMLIINHIGFSYFNYFNGDVGHVRKLLETNFLSYVALTVSALPMLKESEGSIVVVSSMAGKTAGPFTAPYSATKFALDGFFSSLRQEFIIDKVNVSITLCILGYINTDSAVRAVSHVIQSTPAPKEECALEIIKSGALRRRELHYPSWQVGCLLLLRDIAPDFLDSLLVSNYKVENIKRT